MKRVLFAFFLFSAGVQAQEVLKFSVTAPGRSAEEIRDILSPAMALVGAGAPEGILLQPTTLREVDFILEITTSTKAKEEAKRPGAHPDLAKFAAIDGDGYSIFLPDRSDAPVLVRVLWDRAMLTQGIRQGERADAFTRLAVLLGHEIYGNVLYFRRNRAAMSSALDPEARHAAWLAAERNAFRAGADFVERVLDRFGAQLSPKMKGDFMEALEREKEILADYCRLYLGSKGPRG